MGRGTSNRAAALLHRKCYSDDNRGNPFARPWFKQHNFPAVAATVCLLLHVADGDDRFTLPRCSGSSLPPVNMRLPTKRIGFSPESLISSFLAVARG